MPGDAWRHRNITSAQRSQSQTILNRHRQEELTRRSVPDEAAVEGAVQASVGRIAVSRALQQYGYSSRHEKASCSTN
jgi:hypothetical protein